MINAKWWFKTILNSFENERFENYYVKEFGILNFKFFS